MTRGLILFAHGSRSADWREPVAELAASAARREPEIIVTIAWLDHSPPDLCGAADDLVRKGATSLVVVPVFLSAGGHVLRDLGALVERAQAVHPAVPIAIGPTSGESPQVREAIVAAAVAAAIGQRSS